MQNTQNSSLGGIGMKKDGLLYGLNIESASQLIKPFEGLIKSHKTLGYLSLISPDRKTELIEMKYCNDENIIYLDDGSEDSQLKLVLQELPTFETISVFLNKVIDAGTTCLIVYHKYDKQNAFAVINDEEKADILQELFELMPTTIKNFQHTKRKIDKLIAQYKAVATQEEDKLIAQYKAVATQEEDKLIAQYKAVATQEECIEQGVRCQEYWQKKVTNKTLSSPLLSK